MSFRPIATRPAYFLWLLKIGMRILDFCTYYYQVGYFNLLLYHHAL